MVMETKIKHKKKKEKDKGFTQKIKKVEKERDEYLAYAQRCKADFLNYKKEEIERLKGLIDYEKEEWILELLKILDHFERAESETAEQDRASSVIDGFLQIQKYFEDFLKRQGVKEIETRAGRKFDPNFEEVIETIEVQEKEEGANTDNSRLKLK